MKTIYIGSEVIRHKLLRLFKVRHLFLFDDEGNRYEVDLKGKDIHIRETKHDIGGLLNDSEISVKEFRIGKKKFRRR